MPVEYSRHRRRASGRPDARRACSTSATWARSRLPAAMRSRPSSTSPPTTRRGSPIGQAHYSALPTPEGTFVDDVLTYKLTDEHFMLVVNASNIIKDFNWITGADRRDRRRGGGQHQLALRADGACRGRQPREVLQALTGVNLADIKYYWFTTGEVAGVRATVSAHRLHRRGRLRSVRAAGFGRARVGRDPSGRTAGWRGAGRPRRARHAAPRGRDAALRQRHRRHDDRSRSGPRLDDRLEEGRVHRRTRCCAGRSRKA